MNSVETLYRIAYTHHCIRAHRGNFEPLSLVQYMALCMIAEAGPR